MMYLLLGFLAFYATLVYSILQKNNLLEWWSLQMSIILGAVLALMMVVFLVAKKIRRFDLVDAAWGWAFMTAALVSYLLQSGEKLELDVQLLATGLVWIWGIRLSSHIIRRIRATREEDPRYVELRRNWKGNVAWNVFTRVYLLQAVLATIVAMPVIHINLFTDFQPTGWTTLVLAGISMWGVGFLFEMIADRQLRKFVSDPGNKGRIMDTGLWRYSRHPNYFGELLQWWGIFVICAGTPVGWFGVVGPIVLTYLILFVSGIPVTERRFTERKGWAEYKANTSAIIPLPHRQ